MAEQNAKSQDKHIAINAQKFDEARKGLERGLDKGDVFSTREYNAVFRQMASQLILIAGIFLALSAQFATLLSQSSNLVKVLFIIIITLLNASIAFGVLQHLIEANYFKRSVLGKRAIRHEIKRDDPFELQKFLGAYNEFNKIMAPGAKRWPSYVQITLLAVAMVLISIVASLKLYGF